MSFWAALGDGMKKVASALAKANPSLINADIQIVNAAMVATISAVKAMKAGTLSPEQFLTTTDLQLRALALVYPPAATIEPYVEAADIVVTGLDELGFITTGPGLPYKGDGVNPYSGQALGV